VFFFGKSLLFSLKVDNKYKWLLFVIILGNIKIFVLFYSLSKWACKISNCWQDGIKGSNMTTKALPWSLQNALFPFPDGKTSTSLPYYFPSLSKA
jgi:hypothetical protein